MEIKEIIDNKDDILKNNVFPDVIKNRFDILHPLIDILGGVQLVLYKL